MKNEPQKGREITLIRVISVIRMTFLTIMRITQITRIKSAKIENLIEKSSGIQQEIPETFQVKLRELRASVRE